MKAKEILNLMKKRWAVILSLFMFVAIATSCGDDTSDTPDTDIVGTWRLVQRTMVYDNEGSFPQTYEANILYTFGEDGTLTSNLEVPLSLTTSYTFPNSGTYSLPNDYNVTITSEAIDYSENWFILNLTDTQLSLRYMENGMPRILLDFERVSD